MYFFLMTNYSNYVASDEAYWIEFNKAIAKIRKGATFCKQPLDNILFRCYTFKFIYIASRAGINKKHAVYLVFYITRENDCQP